MAVHHTCDGCGAPVDGTQKNQDRMLARVAVHRGAIVLEHLDDLCAVCAETVCASIRRLRDRIAGKDSDA